MRTKPVEYGESPFAWGVTSEKQCTWYAYYETLKRTGYKPCYHDRNKKSGAYNNGKTWLENFREPFMPIKDTNKMPSENDIIVFTGNYGHVAIYEGNNQITDYNRIKPLEFDIASWDKGQILKGSPYNTGKPIGYLHLPQTKPVDRDETRNQIKVNTVEQYLRDKPNGNIISYCFDGYFNVLETKEDKYTWYRIDKDTWIAGVSGRVEFLQANNTKGEQQVVPKETSLESEIKALKERLNKIGELAKYE